MRVIPVIDLLDGHAVHAVKGERERYRPVKSVLCDTSDPLDLARAFRDRLGLDEIYIADLNAIQGSGHTRHREVIEAVARTERMRVLLDAGVSDVENARAWLNLGIHKAVIAAETLGAWDALREIPAQIDPARLVFSLDLRAGKIMSRCRDLAAMPPIEVLKHLESAGWREVLLLDLRRVGSGEGIDRALAAEARALFPDLSLLVGGGIAHPGELAELESMGIAGALAATALHRGIIARQHISALGAAK